MNTIRIASREAFLSGGATNRAFHREYTDYILANTNFNVILDLNHIYPPDESGAVLFRSHLVEIRSFLFEVTRMYANNPRVFIEPINEYVSSDLWTIAQDLMNVIRSAGNNFIILNKWNQSWSGAAGLTDPAQNYGISYHYYFNYWSPSGAEADMQLALNQGLRIVNTEIGANSNGGSAITASEIAELNTFLAWAFVREIGNCLWNTNDDQDFARMESLGLQIPAAAPLPPPPEEPPPVEPPPEEPPPEEPPPEEPPPEFPPFTPGSQMSVTVEVISVGNRYANLPDEMFNGFLDQLTSQGITNFTMRLPSWEEWNSGITETTTTAAHEELMGNMTRLILLARAKHLTVNIDFHTWSTSTGIYLDFTSQMRYRTYVLKVIDELWANPAVYATIQNISVLNECPYWTWPQGVVRDAVFAWIVNFVVEVKAYSSKPISVRWTLDVEKNNRVYVMQVDAVCNVISRNSYADMGDPDSALSPNLTFDEADAVLKDIIARKGSKPLWVTEIGYPMRSTTLVPDATPEKQRTFYALMIPYYVNLGVDLVVCWTIELPDGGDDFNLFSGLIPNPAFLLLKDINPPVTVPDIFERFMRWAANPVNIMMLGAFTAMVLEAKRDRDSRIGS